jgi:hypothetical protein
LATTKTEYLLPCSCGHKLSIDRSQAGLSISCPQCGAEVTVPTLRGFNLLEQAVPEVSKASGEWGLRQGVLFLGCLIAGAALAVAAFLWLTQPVYPQEYQDALIEAAGSTDDLDQMSIVQTFHLWRELQVPPDAATVNEFRLMLEYYLMTVMQFRQRMVIAVGVLIFGLLILGAGLVIPKPKTAIR